MSRKSERDNSVKITLPQLKKRAANACIAIRSTELSLYIAEARIDDQTFIICDGNNKPLKTHNLVAMREQLEAIKPAELVLVHESAYDEMIGLPPREESNRLELPLDPDQNSPAPWLN